jgi:hypothetical protein
MDSPVPDAPVLRFSTRVTVAATVRGTSGSPNPIGHGEAVVDAGNLIQAIEQDYAPALFPLPGWPSSARTTGDWRSRSSVIECRSEMSSAA